uniref:Gluconolactonase domain protein n=1 Tax=Teredinibacter turnerae TaxID=2426 RepID=UPI0030131F05
GGSLINFTDGFESTGVNQQPSGWGNFVGWQSNNPNNNIGQSVYALVDNTRAFTGNNSVHFKGGAAPAQIVRTLPAGLDKVYLKAMVYMSKKLGNEAGDNHEHIFGVRGNVAQADNEVRFGQIKGHVGTNEMPSDDISPPQSQWYSGPEIAADTWHCVVVEMLGGNRPYHQLHAYLDNQLIHSIDSISDWNNGGVNGNTQWLDGKLNYAFFGWHSFSNNNADVWMDDIEISDQPISCDSRELEHHHHHH